MVLRFVFIVILILTSILSMAVYPIALGGLVLIIRFLVLGFICVRVSAFYRLVLLLVFVGGLLVAFGYAIALASNPVFTRTEAGGSYFGVKKFLGRVLVIRRFLGLFLLRDLWLGLTLGNIEFNFQRRWETFISRDWGVLVVLIGGLLFVNIVSVVRICSYYKGALVEFSRRL